MMRRSTTAALVAIAAAVPLVAPPTGEAASRSGFLRFERLVLDTNEGRADGAAGPVRTERRLRRRARYRVTVQGTFSFYPQAMWLTPPAGQAVCGKPESSPRFTLPGQRTGPVGFDAETMFALPTTPEHCDRLNLPRPWKNFQMATGRRFAHPGSGRRSKPKRTHRYSYRVRGLGRPLRLRLVDSEATDNYGALKVTVRRLRSAR
jgi:hypothetical protein